MTEKRKYIRVPDSIKISYKQITKPKFSAFMTKDISLGGIKFFANDFLPINSILKIKITLKTIYFAFETLAKVKWIKKDFSGDRFEIGAEFTDIPSPSAEFLIKYIKGRSKAQTNKPKQRL